MRMHPVTLAFADPAQERRFREDHARRSIPYLRVLLAFTALMTIGLTYMTGLAAEFAALHGLDHLQDLADYVPLAMLGSLVVYSILLGLSYWPSAMRWLQVIVAACFVIGFTVDALMTLRVAPEFATAGAITTVVMAYFALRLRIVPSVVIGSFAAAVYLGAGVVANDLAGDPSSEVVFDFMVNGVYLLAINVVCAFIAYQYEVLARNRFLQTELVARQKERLEAALRDLKETETQLIESEKQASLGRFVAGLLHEVNSPLGALTSATATIDTGLDRCQQLVEDPPVTAADRERTIRSIEAARTLLALQTESAQRIARLVADLKGFVGLDAAERRSIDMRLGIESALRLLAGDLGGIEVESELPDHPVLVDCYPGQLNQVFLRVLQNSVEALKGRGTIRVSVNETDRRVRIRFEDDGPGIVADRLPKLFDPTLVREGSRVKMNLGLPTSKRAVEKIGGVLTLSSREGAGTVVTIDLPALPAPGHDGAVAASPVDTSVVPR